MIVIDQDQGGRSIDLPAGQVMELRLAENPTTGYRWTFISDGAPVCVVVSDRFESSAGPPGHGGEHRWQIKASQAGACDISLRYDRNFASDAQPKAFSFHVRVIP